MVSSNASLSYAEIIASAAPSQTLFFQLYKHANNDVAERRVREVERLGYKAICLTVDAIVPGNRERDIRSPWDLEDMERGKPEVHGEITDGVLSGAEINTLGTAGALIVNDDRDMTWETVRRSEQLRCSIPTILLM
jgi:L-lactate dehydrogenase (cytochrome)